MTLSIVQRMAAASTVIAIGLFTTPSFAQKIEIIDGIRHIHNEGKGKLAKSDALQRIVGSKNFKIQIIKKEDIIGFRAFITDLSRHRDIHQ